MNQSLIALAKAAGSFSVIAIWLWLRKQPTAAERRRRALNYVGEPKWYPPLSSDPLQVETERFLDTDQETEDGPCSYYYAGMRYSFRHGTRRAGARFYDDDPFGISISVEPPQDVLPGARYADPPYRDPFFAEIVEYLRAHEPQRERQTFFCEAGYVPIDQDKLAGAARDVSARLPPSAGSHDE